MTTVEPSKTASSTAMIDGLFRIIQMRNLLRKLRSGEANPEAARICAAAPLTSFKWFVRLPRLLTE